MNLIQQYIPTESSINVGEIARMLFIPIRKLEGLSFLDSEHVSQTPNPTNSYGIITIDTIMKTTDAIIHNAYILFWKYNSIKFLYI
jgi:hypothetical protein